MSWSYERDETKPEYKPISKGKHRIRIKSAEKASSSKGNDMLALQFDVSGEPGTLYHYIVFLPDRPEITNRNLTQFFDAFPGIPNGDFDMTHWIGKVGACEVKHEEWNGNMSAKIRYFIHADKQKDLPPWKEEGVDENGFVTPEAITDEQMPF